MSREPIWLRPEPGGRKPSLTRERIAAAALEIADTEGFDAVSMRNVARRLEVGTMSLYHYIRTKDDLYALMDDLLMSEVLVPDGDLPEHWRDALAEIARRSHAAWTKRPWTLWSMSGARIGPNGMKHVEQSIAAVSGVGLSRAEQLELISLVDDYVIGFAMRERELGHLQGDDWEEFEAMAGYMSGQLGTGEYPHLREFVGEHGDVVAAWRSIAAEAFRDDRFERGLNVLLDGVALMLDRRAQ